MGDVAMTIPVIRQLIEQHPDLFVTFVSDKKFKSLFNGIERLDFFGADVHEEFRGFKGLFRLYRLLKKNKKITAIADLHEVLRTKVLSFFFKLSGYKIRTIDKGRIEKSKLTSKQNKKLEQLPTTFSRYAEVFEKLGYPISLGALKRESIPPNDVVRQLLGQKDVIRIAVAPFAKHNEKMYPLDEMEKVVNELVRKGYKLYFFGGGISEIDHLEQWENKFSGTLNIAGELSLEEELMLISQMNLVISMDSANMHLASMFGVPVVSIWGATHPFAGFYGYGQKPEYAVQADLFCRPCSVFGNKKCYRGDLACMKLITPENIIAKVEEVLMKTSL